MLKDNLNNLTLRSKYSPIPKEIIDLLWFSNGPFKNYYGVTNEINFNFYGNIISIKASITNEPSAIDINLPLIDKVESVPPLDYYPSYNTLTTQQRSAYLNWLSDITTPIDIGYVFLFYYGLERHLFWGNSEKALSTIFLLRKHHNNMSFWDYSGNAIVLYALIHNRPDILKELNINLLSVDLNLFVSALINNSFSAQSIIKSHKYFGFDNNRYIKKEPGLFLSILERLLIERYDSDVYSVSYDDFASSKGKMELVLANYSLLPKQRFIELPDITTCPRIHNDIYKLLESTHEIVKKQLREQRKTNTNGSAQSAAQKNLAQQAIEIIETKKHRKCTYTEKDGIFSVTIENCGRMRISNRDRIKCDFFGKNGKVAFFDDINKICNYI